MTDPPCIIDPDHGRGSFGSDIGAMCPDCWHTRIARGVECLSGDINGPPLVDAPADPKDGGYDWHHRPPRTKPDLHHDQQIIIGGVLHWQQATPVHGAGRFDTDPKQARYIGQQSRQSRRHRRELAVALVGIPVAEAGKSASQLKRRLRKRHAAK